MGAKVRKKQENRKHHRHFRQGSITDCDTFFAKAGIIM